MPNPTKFFSDPESDQQSNVGPKGWGTLEEKVKPKGNSLSDPIDEDAQPESSGPPSKTGRVEPVKPKGQS